MDNHFNEDWFHKQFSKSECEMWVVGRDIMASVKIDLTAEEQHLLQTEKDRLELNLSVSMPECTPCVFFSGVSDEVNEALGENIDQAALQAVKKVLKGKEHCGLVSKWLAENDRDTPAYRPLTDVEKKSVEDYLQRRVYLNGRPHKSAQDVIWTLESMVIKLAKKMDEDDSSDIYMQNLLSCLIEMKKQITNEGLPTIPDIEMYYAIRLNDEEIAVELVHLKLDYTLSRAFGLEQQDENGNNHAIVPYRKTIYFVKFPLLSVTAYAEMHNIEQVTVRQWIRRGKLRTAIRNGRDWLIPVTTVPPIRGFTTAKYHIIHNPPEAAKEKYPFLNNVSSYNTIRIDRLDASKYIVQKYSSNDLTVLATLKQTEREAFEYSLIEAEWAKIDLNEKYLRMPLTAEEEEKRRMDAETRKEEAENLLRSIISLSKDGTLHWECTEYNPISAMSGDNSDDFTKPEPYVSHMYSLKSEYQGNCFELEICETINLNDEKGSIGFELYVENDRATSQKIEMNIALDEKYDELCAAQLLTEYAEHPAVLLADLVINHVDGSPTAEETFTWARFINETSFPKSAKRNLITKLSELLMIQHRVADFHKCVLDLEFRNQLIQNELGTKSNT